MTLPAPIDLHIDANGIDSRGHPVFAPYSHDAGTGINDAVPIPAPGAPLLMVLAAAALAARTLVAVARR